MSHLVPGQFRIHRTSFSIIFGETSGILTKPREVYEVEIRAIRDIREEGWPSRSVHRRESPWRERRGAFHRGRD